MALLGLKTVSRAHRYACIPARGGIIRDRAWGRATFFPAIALSPAVIQWSCIQAPSAFEDGRHSLTASDTHRFRPVAHATRFISRSHVVMMQTPVAPTHSKLFHRGAPCIFRFRQNIRNFLIFRRRTADENCGSGAKAPSNGRHFSFLQKAAAFQSRLATVFLIIQYPGFLHDLAMWRCVERIGQLFLHLGMEPGVVGVGTGSKGKGICRSVSCAEVGTSGRRRDSCLR